MNYIIREINENETAVLEDFLYEAIFVPEGVQPPEKNIIKKPELQVYVAGFGKKGRRFWPGCRGECSDHRRRLGPYYG